MASSAREEGACAIPLAPSAKPPSRKDLPGTRIRLELYEMRKAQAQLAARQRLLQDKILEERERAAALAALENTRVQRKLEAAEKTLTELLKPQQAAKSATATELKRSPSLQSLDDDISEVELGPGERVCEDPVESEQAVEEIEAKETGSVGIDTEFQSWFICYTESGERYFYCEETQESVWDDPRNSAAQHMKQIPPSGYWHDLWREAPASAAMDNVDTSSTRPAYADVQKKVAKWQNPRVGSARTEIGNRNYPEWDVHQPMSAREVHLQRSLENMKRIVAEAKQNELRALSRAEATALTQAHLVERVRQEERRQLARDTSFRSGSVRTRPF